MTSKDMVPAPGAGALAVASTLMPPPAPRARKRKDTVLEEDDWTNKLEAIIERDYFPELGKLQDKVRWLEAVRSGDPEQIRAAQLAIVHRQTGGSRPFTGATPTPGPLFTPGGTAARVLDGATPRVPFTSPGVGSVPENEAVLAGASLDAAPNVSLDTFVAQHTSEDNASFSEILDEENKKRREKAALLLQAPRDRALMITDGRDKAATDGFGTSGQPTDTLLGWNYKPINWLYSEPQESIPLSSKELADRVQGPPKQINSRNTRFKPTPTPGQPTPSTSGNTSSMHSRGTTPSMTTNTIPGGLPAGPTVPRQHGGVSGYDILATPKFEPGVDATPFMTWGDIEATPMRIEAEDLPPGATLGSEGGGRSFRMNAAPAREQRGHALASKAATNLRKRAILRGATPSIAGTAAGAVVAAATGGGRYGTPSRTPVRTPGGSKTPLSAAARKLVSGMGKGRKSGAADMALRASYNQTPRRRGGSATPSHGSSWTPARGTTPDLRHISLVARGKPPKSGRTTQGDGKDVTDALLDI